MTTTNGAGKTRRKRGKATGPRASYAGQEAQALLLALQGLTFREVGRRIGVPPDKDPATTANMIIHRTLVKAFEGQGLRRLLRTIHWLQRAVRRAVGRSVGKSADRAAVLAALLDGAEFPADRLESAYQRARPKG